MKSKTALRRLNPYAACSTLLTALVFCAIVGHAQNATADVTRTISVIGSSALASFADTTGTLRRSTSGAVQAHVGQVKSYTPTQTGTATYRVGSLTGRSNFSVTTFSRETEAHF